MSKIPPEFRQAALERAGVDRQEVSDSFVFHMDVRRMGERDGGQLICLLMDYLSDFCIQGETPYGDELLRGMQFGGA